MPGFLGKQWHRKWGVIDCQHFVANHLNFIFITASLCGRGLDSRSNKKMILGSPLTLSGGLAHARQLNSQLFVLGPSATTFGLILVSHWSLKSQLYYVWGVLNKPQKVALDSESILVAEWSPTSLKICSRWSAVAQRAIKASPKNPQQRFAIVLDQAWVCFCNF